MTAATAALPPRQANRNATLLVVCLAQFILQLDFSIVNVALPSIQRELGFTAAGLQWIVTGFALTFGSLLLFGGRAGDLFGQRKVLMVGLTVFGIGSVFCGAAQDPLMLIGARVLQGVGGALVSPSALATLTKTSDDGAARVRALGVWQATTAAGAMTGVLAGGALTEYVGWRSIFLVNVPIVIGLLMLVPRMLPSTGRRERGSLQLAPSVLVSLAIACLIAALNQSEQHGFVATVPALCFAGAALFAVLLWLYERRRNDKLIDPVLLTLLQRRGALVSLIILGGVLTSYVYFGSLYMQSMLKFAPLTTGLALLPGTVVNIVLAALLSRRIIAKLGIRVTAAIGLLCLAAGQGWFANVSDHGDYVHTVLPAALLTSFGIGLTAPALTVAATAGVTKPLQGTGASLVATAQSIGSAVGLAVLGTIADTVTQDHHGSIVDGYTAAFIVAATTIVAATLIVTGTFSDHKHTITGAAAAHRMP